MAAEKSLSPEKQHEPAGHMMPAEIAEKIVPAKGRSPAKPLEERYFKTRVNDQNDWYVKVYSHITVEDLLNRDYWSGVARSLRFGDKIVCASEDKRMYVELVVVAVGGTWAEVRVFGEPIIITSDVATMGRGSDYVVKDLGLIKGWGVVHTPTGREVKADGSLKTEDAARGWLREFISMENRRVA